MEGQAKRLPGGGRVREYYAQLATADGCYQLETGKVPRRCRDCGRDDSTVQGLWGPIFGEGRQGRPVLLCQTCYDRRCEE